MIPHLNPHTGLPQPASLIDGNDQDPTPMHAYAASGHQAPRICRVDEHTFQIECPGCGSRCDIAVNNCTSCGMPFTLEGVPTAPPRGVQSFATTAMVLGILAIPLAPLLVIGGLAVLFGAASWLRQGGPRPAGRALAGVILGLISLALGLAQHLL